MTNHCKVWNDGAKIILPFCGLDKLAQISRGHPWAPLDYKISFIAGKTVDEGWFGGRSGTVWAGHGRRRISGAVVHAEVLFLLPGRIKILSENTLAKQLMQIQESQWRSGALWGGK